MAEQAMPAFVRPIGMQDAASIRQELMHLDALPLVIESLVLDMSPRQGGENDEHARALAESEERLPPIVVHGPSMRVIDGIHRVRAAIIRGEKTIPGRVYHGTDEEAFVLAVGMNIAHGLPLTRADRTAAAVRVIHSYPQWSDRMISTVVGLSAGTVAKVSQHGPNRVHPAFTGSHSPFDKRRELSSRNEITYAFEGIRLGLRAATMRLQWICCLIPVRWLSPVR